MALTRVYKEKPFTTRDMSTSDVHAPSSNTAAVVTYTAVSGEFHVISGVAYSYDATPTGGNLLIEDGTDDVFSIDIPAAGEGVFYFDPAKRGSVNTNMVITLAAGGASVTGKVSVLGHWTEENPSSV